MSTEGDEIVAMLEEQINGKRLMAWIIDPHLICDILAGRALIANLPADAAVVRWATPYEINGLALIVWSASYAPVPGAERIPHAMAQIERR